MRQFTSTSRFGELIFNNNLTINEGGILPFANTMMHDTWFSRTLKTFCEENDIPLTIKLEFVSDEKKDLILLLRADNPYRLKVPLGEKTTGIFVKKRIPKAPMATVFHQE